MSLSVLPSGRLRAQVFDPSTRKNISVAKVLRLPKGQSTWPNTRQGRRDATKAREQARELLGGTATQIVTLQVFADRWTTDPIFARPKDSTNIHNARMVRPFVKRYGTVALLLIGDDIVAEWLAGGTHNSTVPALRAMFNDAKSAKAGRLVDRNPFAELGLSRGKGNAEVDPPDPETVERMIVAARKFGGPFYAAWLQVACATGMRPGELDALRWTAINWDESRIHVNEQFNEKSKTFTSPKNGKKRKAILTPPAREALLELPRMSKFCFVNTQNQHWTVDARTLYWNKVRAACGFDGSLYLATRHYAGWHMTNVLGLDAEIVAIALGHEDGGYLVKALYGHRSKDAALATALRAYEGQANVRPLRAVEDV